MPSHYFILAIIAVALATIFTTVASSSLVGAVSREHTLSSLPTIVPGATASAVDNLPHHQVALGVDHRPAVIKAPRELLG